MGEFEGRMKLVNLDTETESGSLGTECMGPSGALPMAACPLLGEDSGGQKLLCEATHCRGCPHLDRHLTRDDLWVCPFCTDVESLGFYSSGTCEICGLADMLLQLSKERGSR